MAMRRIIGGVEPTPRRGAAEPSPLLTGLFPAGLVAAELRGEADPATLYPEERGGTGTFGAVRLADFAGGRLCARYALAALGFARFPLLAGADRRPRWPDEVVGSISHAAGFSGAAVASRERLRAVGFDVERLGRASEELWPALLTEAEAERMRSLPEAQRTLAATIVFSAKEAYYKCQFEITGAWLEFTDVEIALAADSENAGTFQVAPLGSAPRPEGVRLAGRYALDPPFVFCGIAIPALP